MFLVAGAMLSKGTLGGGRVLKEEFGIGIISVIIQYAKHQNLFSIFLIGAVVTIVVAILTKFSRVATFSGSLAMLATAMI